MTSKDNVDNEDVKTCDWCGGPLGERTWKDGRKVFCSSSCQSASIFPVMVLGILTLTALIIASLIFPQIVLEQILGPFANVFIIVLGMYAVMVVLYIAILKICYDGWQTRKRRQIDDTSIDGINSYD